MYHGARSDGSAAPTAAVLVRRNADAAPMADALAARGVPVEVVGLAGLLAVPEVADLVATLRLVADPTAGAAAMQVLSGPRWRLGGRDIAALWRRAVELDDRPTHDATTEQIVAQAAADADAACLADAICDPGPAEAYSAAGHSRIVALGRELTALRAHLTHPLPDLVAEVRRVLGIDAEVRAARPVASGWSGTEHLDAFADVVADFAARPGATMPSLLAYLDAAVQVENGLAPAEVDRRQRPGADPHRARRQGLGVAGGGGATPERAGVPVDGVDAHLAHRRRGSAAAAARRPRHRIRARRPGARHVDVNDRKRLSDKISDHKRCLEQRRIDEERRLLYVAITRAEDTLLLSGHHWGASEAKPRGPSDFLCELKDIIEMSEAAGDPCGVVEHWAPTPPDGESNPLRDRAIEALWPTDPVGAQRRDVDNGAAMVTQAMSGGLDASTSDVDGWAADVDALLAERDRAADPPVPASPAIGWGPSLRGECPQPAQLSVSTLVELGRDPDAVAQRLRRRLPTRPDPHALLGTAFHDWVQRFFHAERLFDLDDLPGAVDRDAGDAEDLAELQAAFAVSPWAARTPIDVEVPFDMVIGGRVVAGAHRRDLRRRRRRHHGGGLEDRRTPRRARSQAACGDSACGVPAGVGATAWLPGGIGARGIPLRAIRANRHARITARRRRPRRAAGRGLGVAVDLQRRSDHRDLQRQTGDRAEPHDQRLVPPQPDQVDVRGEHPDEHGDRRQRAKLAGARRQPPCWRSPANMTGGCGGASADHAARRDHPSAARIQ